MIVVQADRADLKRVQRKLGDMRSKTPQAMRDAANKTAVTARKLLRQHAQERYMVKAGGFNAHMKIDKATLSNPTAVVRASDRPITLRRFNTKRDEQEGVFAKVLRRRGRMKQLTDPETGNKAFYGTGKKSDAPMVFTRVGKNRYPLEAAFGPASSKMLEVVYRGGVSEAGLQEQVEALYQRNLDQQIRRFVAQ